MGRLFFACCFGGHYLGSPRGHHFVRFLAILGLLAADKSVHYAD